MSTHRDSIVLPVINQAAMPASPQSSKALRWLLYGAAAVVMLLCFFAVLLLIGTETGPIVLIFGLLMAVAPVPFYAGLTLWLDRFEPEPIRLLVIVFAWGATIAAFTAFLLNSIGTAIVVDAYGEDAGLIYGGSISAPIVEEAAKGAVLFILYWWKRNEINGVLDGVVYSVMVGLGFAMTENVLYYGRGAYSEGIVGAVGTFILRGIMSPFAHPVFTAATGIGIGLAVMSRHAAVRWLAPPVGLLCAMLLHSLWNTAAGGGAFLGVYLLIMVPIFGAVIAIVLVSRHRERQLVQRHLADGLGGFLTPAEVQMLGSAKGRREARKFLKARAGAQAAKTLAMFQEVITEYAYFRERGARGLLVNDPKAFQTDADLSNQIRSLHAQLLQLGGGGQQYQAGPGHQVGYQSPPQIGGVAEWGPSKGYSQVGWAVPREVAVARAAELRASQYLPAIQPGQAPAPPQQQWAQHQQQPQQQGYEQQGWGSPPPSGH